MLIADDELLTRYDKQHNKHSFRFSSSSSSRGSLSKFVA